MIQVNGWSTLSIGNIFATQAPVARRSQSAGFSHFDVMVLDAECRQSLASARSLGRAGLRVVLGESHIQYHSRHRLPAFSSRYCTHNLMLPSYAGDGVEFATAILEFVDQNPTRIIIPAGDASIAALRPFWKELAELGCVLAVAPDSALDIANSKDSTLEIARELGIDQPESRHINNADDLAAVIAEFGYPFVLKPPTSWTGQSAFRMVPVDVINEAEAVAAAQRFLAAGSGVLAQQWAPGRREGVTLFIDHGDVLASCGHIEYRTSPPLGGASVLREIIQTPPDIYYPAVRLATAIGIEGICEVEFRRDAYGRPLLMEINARMAGTIENAIQSGINFPLMIWQWANELPIDRVDTYRAGVRSRWLRGDLRWLRDNRAHKGRPDSVSQARAIWMFCAEFTRTWRYDCFDLRDLRPVFAELRSIAGTVRTFSTIRS
jgi:predicted ATP-grasp superfamily ATP-dependent carboligase